MSDTKNESTEFEPITTQEELNRIVTQRLTREREKHARDLEKFADYDDLKAAAAEVETLRTSLADREADVAHKDVEILKLTISADKGVPARLLTGETEDDIKASAEELLKFKGATPEPPAESDKDKDKDGKDGKPADKSSEHNGPINGLDHVDHHSNRDEEARQIFGI